MPSAETFKFCNVIILGLAFMGVFTAFQTCGMIEQTVLENWNNHTGANTNQTASGYTSLAIIYGSFAASNWVAPSVVSVLGPRFSMMSGAVVYSVFIASFLFLTPWLLYALSALLGLGAAVIWTAQGNYLTLMSTKDTIGRNSGVFWALLQCSLIWGNLFVSLTLQTDEDIDKNYQTVFIVLTVVSVVGLLMFLLLIPMKAVARLSGEDYDSIAINSESTDLSTGPKQAFISSVKLFIQPDMLLLCICFFYTGLELTFFSGVYGTCIANTESLQDNLLGVSGMLIGAGEIFGGVLFGLFGKRTNKYGRDPIVLLGYLVHMGCFYLILLNLPHSSPTELTKTGSYIGPLPSVALLCAFLLGFGDACFNTQIYSLLGDVYDNNSAPAFAIFKFVQSVAAAAGFLYSSHLDLFWQLGILMVFGTIGVMSFFKVQWKSRSDGYEPLQMPASVQKHDD